jgi:hypothetical protein
MNELEQIIKYLSLVKLIIGMLAYLSDYAPLVLRYTRDRLFSTLPAVSGMTLLVITAPLALLFRLQTETHLNN